MSNLPAGVAAFIAVSELAGPMILLADALPYEQQTVAKLMALTAVVRTHKKYASITMDELREVFQLLPAA